MSNKLQDLINATIGIDLGLDEGSGDINAQIAVASLLAVAANSDGSIDREETVKVVEALCGRFALAPNVALDLIARAVDNLSIQEDSSKLFDELNKCLDSKQKEELVLTLLEVIAADGQKDAAELAMFNRSVSALKISDDRLSDIYKRYFANRRKNES